VNENLRPLQGALPKVLAAVDPSAMLRQFQGHFEPNDHDRMLRHSKRLGQSAAEYLRRALMRQLDLDDDLEPPPAMPAGIGADPVVVAAPGPAAPTPEQH
jgi:hypothetical protein